MDIVYDQIPNHYLLSISASHLRNDTNSCNPVVCGYNTCRMIIHNYPLIGMVYWLIVYDGRRRIYSRINVRGILSCQNLDFTGSLEEPPTGGFVINTGNTHKNEYMPSLTWPLPPWWTLPVSSFIYIFFLFVVLADRARFNQYLIGGGIIFGPPPPPEIEQNWTKNSKFQFLICSKNISLQTPVLPLSVCKL